MENSPTSSASAESSPIVRAAMLMAASAVLFGCMAITIRYAARQLHTFEVAFFRNLFGLLFALPLFLRHGRTLLSTNKLPLYFLRCVIGLISMLAGFWAIIHLPLAQAVSISYSTPLFVTIGAVLFLDEVVGRRRWSAVLIGFIGVLLIARPGADSFSAGIAIALLAAAMSASVTISIKILSRTESADAIVLYTTLIWAPLSLIPALTVWQWPEGITWLWVVLAGFFGTCAHLLWTRALRLGDVSLVTPISFIQLPIVAVLAYFLFDEKLLWTTAVGATIIIGSNVYITHRETRLARRLASDPQIAAAEIEP